MKFPFKCKLECVERFKKKTALKMKKIEICKRMVKHSVNDPIILAFRKEIRSF